MAVCFLPIKDIGAFPSRGITGFGIFTALVALCSFCKRLFFYGGRVRPGPPSEKFLPSFPSSLATSLDGWRSEKSRSSRGGGIGGRGRDSRRGSHESVIENGFGGEAVVVDPPTIRHALWKTIKAWPGIQFTNSPVYIDRNLCVHHPTNVCQRRQVFNVHYGPQSPTLR